jgi:hypothetical protein
MGWWHINVWPMVCACLTERAGHHPSNSKKPQAAKKLYERSWTRFSAG